MSIGQKLTAAAALSVYALVAFEFLFMITPFLALAYYPAYGGMLAWLAEFSWTAGLTTFFLPHFSQTDDAVMDSLTRVGFAVTVVGIVLFVAAAVPLYFSKLFRRQAVTGGLYKLIRHPQYLAFIVMGIGLVFIWPRFIALYMLVAMIFIYIALARYEERDCLAKYGDDYGNYLEKTGAFLPKWIPAPHIVPQGASIMRWVVTFTIAMVLAGSFGIALREHAIGHISAVFKSDEVIVSPARMSEEEMEAAYRIAIADSRVQRQLEGRDGPGIVYVLPQEWYMPDLPIDPLEYTREHGGHGANADFDRTKLQILFASADTYRPDSRGAFILRNSFGITPITIVDVDVSAAAVEQILDPPPHTVWGDFPMPLF